MTKITQKEFIDRANAVHKNAYSYCKCKYEGSKIKTCITCTIHGDFFQTPNCHLSGSGCKLCDTNKRKRTIKEFINKSNKIHNNKYDYSQTTYHNAKSQVIIKCPIHGHFKQIANNHLLGFGCLQCARDELHSNNSLTTSEFISKANTIHNSFYTYNNTKYIKNFIKIIITCPRHGDFNQTPSSHLMGKGCPICRSSKGEILIEKFLNKNNIKYIPEKTFDDCKYKNLLPFDFYLPLYNICVEFDGQQHFEVVDGWGGKPKLKQIQTNDTIKTNYCLNNGIPLIRIKYTEINNIEVLLSSLLIPLLTNPKPMIE